VTDNGRRNHHLVRYPGGTLNCHGLSSDIPSGRTLLGQVDVAPTAASSGCAPLRRCGAGRCTRRPGGRYLSSNKATWPIPSGVVTVIA
jgi:hypothetical protein